MSLNNKLIELEQNFLELEQKLAHTPVFNDKKEYTGLVKEHRALEKVMAIYRQYKKCLQDLAITQTLLNDDEEISFKEIAKQEVSYLQKIKQDLELQLEELLLPKDPNDIKDCVLEIRAGVGGKEAEQFAGELFEMYQRYIAKEQPNWSLKVVHYTQAPLAGFREIISTVSGKGAYGLLKYESGVHRIQRVPDTETQGRVHTSTVTVAVLPQMNPIEVHLDPKDIRKDVFCASGPGGQSVNTTYSAVRLTDLSTGIVVSCQDQKSQIKNYEKALQVLCARRYAYEKQKQHAIIDAERRGLVKNADRSDKIRTYNKPQDRVTDHRANCTIYGYERVMSGAELDKLISAVRTASVQNSTGNEGLDA